MTESPIPEKKSLDNILQIALIIITVIILIITLHKVHVVESQHHAHDIRIVDIQLKIDTLMSQVYGE
jgi:hypothetical protein